MCAGGKVGDNFKDLPIGSEKDKFLPWVQFPRWTTFAVTRAKKEVTLIGRQHSSVFLELQEIFKKLSFMLKVS